MTDINLSWLVGFPDATCMKAYYGVNLGIFECSVLDHRLGSAWTFFRRLKQKLDVSGKLSPVPRKQLGCTKCHSHVGIVSTGVHTSFNLRGKWKTGFLAYWQGIHIGPYGYGFARSFTPKKSHDAVTTHAYSDLQAKFPQSFCNKGCGLGDIKSYFRILVEVSSPGNELLLQFLSLFFYLFYRWHERPSFFRVSC